MNIRQIYKRIFIKRPLLLAVFSVVIMTVTSAALKFYRRLCWLSTTTYEETITARAM